MVCMNNLQKQRGFSLVEAMFSALILGIALLGLAGFHTVALQDGTLVKARSVAANLAQEKLDDLRSFTRLEDDGDATNGDECGAGTFCFSEIAGDTGGQEDGVDLVLPSGAVDGYIDNYTLAWTVTCSTETAGSALSFDSACTGATAKLATVTVSWTDSKGASQSVSLQGVIYAMDPARLAMGAASSFSSQKPVAGYTPIGVPDGVPVPIDTGTGEYKESSKPVPDVVSNDIGAEVSFDAVSYVSNGDGGYNTTAIEEFSTVSCECEFNGNGTGYAPSRMIWDDAAGGLAAKIGDQISKPVGQVASNGQSTLCTACCKDHHDATGQPVFDPDRPDSEYVSGDHKHYWYSGCVAGTLGKTNGCNSADKDPAAGYAVVDSGAYLESCRFKRVDGFWRIWQDWRQVRMTVIPYGYLQVDANLNNYVEVIKATVENTIRTDSANGAKIIPALDNRNITLAVGGIEQLLGRAVYVDRIYEADSPTTLDSAYYTKLVGLINADSDWLNIAPFYEANLTLLIDWSSSLLATATVTSQPIVDINNVSNGYYDSYSRGKVTAVAVGTATIAATARLHNTGITGGINTSSPSYGISGYDNTGPLSDFITVTVTDSSGTVGISGKFIRSNESVIFGTLQISGATCSLTPVGNEMSFSCDVSSGASPTLTYSSTVGSTYAFSPSSESFNNVTSGVTAQTVVVYGPTLKISGNLSKGSGTPNLNKVTVNAVSTSGTTACAVTVSSYTCTLPNSDAGFTGTIVFSDNDSNTYIFSPVSPHSYTNQRADVISNVTVDKP